MKGVIIGVIVGVLALVVAGGVFFMNKQVEADFNEPCLPSEKLFGYDNFPEGTYNGPLFDAHLHLTGQDSQESPEGIEYDKLFVNQNNAENIFEMFDTLGVTSMIGFQPLHHDFFVINKKWTDPFFKQSMKIGNEYCGRVHHFIHPESLLGIKSREYFTTELMDDYVKKYPIKGIGEIHVDEENPLYKDIRLNDEEMFELYAYAAENNLVVMIHPRESDLDDLHDALQNNPKTKILLHGDEGIENIISPLIQKHDNLYYSIDAGLMYPYSMTINEMTKKEFLDNLQSEEMYDKILESALNNWKPLIEEYPNRIMWGTDALYSWHFDREVYGGVVRFTRDFIRELDPEVQEKFAYKNAEMLIEEIIFSEDEPSEIIDESEPLLTKWEYDNGWKSIGDPPSCSNPLVLQSPVDLSLVTSVLYPGQLRGGNYKPHGGFRFDNTLADGVKVTLPMDAYLVEGGRYIADGEVQYTLDFINSCGIMYRFGHLLELTPKFAQIAETFPEAVEGDSRTYDISPPVFVKTGETISTAVGFREANNIAVDFGVYDLRQENEISKDQEWSEKYGGSQGSYAVCWIDLLTNEDSIIVKSLPGADGQSGKESDYC